MSDVICAEGRDKTYETALELHEAIVHSAQAAALSLMEMCRGLKKMRDTRLYESLGHSSFDDYCEKMAGIRARQAYTYIAVYERFGEARLAANASLGVTKLELISRLPFSEQDSVLEEAGLEGMSVAQLRAMAEQYRTVGHQEDMLAGGDRAEEEADLEAEMLEEVRRRAFEEGAAEYKTRLADAEAKHKADLEAEADKRKDEVKAAVDRRLKKESAKAAEKAAEEARRLAEEETAAKYRAEIDELHRAAAAAEEISKRLREKLRNADGQYAALKVYFAAIRENFVRASELIATFDGGERDKYTAAFGRLLDALREEILSDKKNTGGDRDGN